MTHSRKIKRSAVPSGIAVLVLAMLVSWTTEVSATLILTYRSSAEIIIAADSLRNIRTTPGKQSRACKIRNFGDILFAASGDTSRPGGIFSLDAITAGLHQGNEPVREPVEKRLRKFDERTVAAFRKVHHQSREIGPVTFTYIVSFLRDGHPTAYIRTLQSTDGVPSIGEIEEVREDVLLAIGQSGTADDMPEGIKRDSDRRWAILEAIIDHQARRTPNKVGGPVDIIRLTSRGSEWLQRKPECPEAE